MFCYYCGRDANHPLQISPSFTATGVRSPHSSVMCDRCDRVMFGDYKQVWVFNGVRQQWVTMFFYGMSQLWRGNQLIYPNITAPEEKVMVSASGQVKAPKTLPVAGLPVKRAEIREWLVNPPEPPFTIAIAESGKKHILYLAQEGCDRSFFPVQFELDTLYLEHDYFLRLLNAFESLMDLGFSKTEITTGVYRADRIRSSNGQYLEHDIVLTSERTRAEPTRLLQLVAFVALSSEPETGSTTCNTESPAVATPLQLTLVL